MSSEWTSSPSKKTLEILHYTKRREAKALQRKLHQLFKRMANDLHPHVVENLLHGHYPLGKLYPLYREFKENPSGKARVPATSDVIVID